MAVRTRAASWWAVAAIAVAGGALAWIPSASAADLFWSGNGTSQGGAGTWDTGNARWGTVAGGPYGTTWNNTTNANDTAVFGSTSGTVTLGTPITAGGLTFNTTNYSITGSTLTLSGAAAPVISAGSSITATISSNIDGTNGLQKTGAGTLILSGTNTTYSGTTTVNAGTLQGNQSTTSGPSPFGTSTIQLNAGTTLNSFTVSANDNAETFTFGNDVNLGGNAAIYLSRNGGIGSNKTHAYGKLSIGDSTLSVTGAGISPALSFTGANLTGNAIINNNSAYAPVNIGAITETGGPRSLTKQGTNTLRLLGTNTYTGSTTISGGVLQLGNGGTAGSLAGTSGITNNATLTVNRSNAFTQAVDLNGKVIAGTGAFTHAGTGAITLSLGNSYTGATAVQQGTLSINSIADFGTDSAIGKGTSGTAITLGNAATTGTLEYTGGVQSTDRTIQINGTTGTQTGGATITNNGTGTLTFTASTFNSAYTNASTVTRTLTLGGFNNGIIQGVIQNNSATNIVGVTKTGVGTWTLSGSNAYTGATAVNGGRLVLDYATQNNTKLSDTGALTLGGSELVLKGGSHTEIVVSATVSAGGSVISRDGGTSVVQLNAITRSAQGTLAFAEASIATTDSTNVNSILGGWATIGSDWAINSTNLGDGEVTALAAYTGTLPTATGASTGNYNLTGTQTQTGAVAANSLKITNTGTLSLGANNLTITAASATSLGGILYAGGGDGNYTIGSTTGRIVPSTSNVELIFQATSGTLTVNALVAANNASSVVTKSGSGTLVLGAANNFTGAVRVNQGALRLTNATGAGTTAGGITVQNAAALELANDISVGAEALSISGTGVAGGGALRNVSGANTYSGTITAAAAFSIESVSGTLTLNSATAIATSGFNGSLGGAGAIAVSGAVTGAGSLTKTGTGTVTLSGNNSYTGGTQISDGVLVLGNAGGLGSSGAISFGGGTLQYGSGVTTDLSSRYSTAASQAYRIDTNGENVTQATALTSAGGSLTKLGAGSLTLAAANTYTGNTTIAAGTVITGTANAISGSSAITIGSASSQGFLEIDHPLTISSLTFTGSGGDVSALSTGTATLSAASGTATITVLSGSNAFHATATLSSPTVVNVWDGAFFSFHNNLFGGADLTKSGSGTMLITGDNDQLAGNLFVTGGRLNIGPGMTQLGTGTTTVSGGATLDLNGHSFGNTINVISGTLLNQALTTATTTITGVTTVGGTAAGVFNINAGGVATFTSTLGEGASTIDVNVNNGGQAVFNGVVSGSADVVVNTGGQATFADAVTAAFYTHVSSTTRFDSTGTQNVSGQIDGPGAVVKQGAGLLVLGGTNSTFTGGVTVTSGTIQAGNAQALGTGPLAVNAGGLDLNGLAVSVGALSGSSSASIFSNGGAASLITNVTGASSFAGVIGDGSGVVSLRKTGAGVLTLTSPNTYTGNTVIADGTLALGSGGSFANSAAIVVGDATSSGAVLDLSALTSLTIGAGQTLQGKGTVLLGASTVLTVAGLLSPGNSPGLLTYSSGTTILTGTTLMEIWGTSRGANPGYDAMDVINGATLTLGGLLNLDLNQNYASDTSFQLINATGGLLSGTYASFTITGSNSVYVGLGFTLQSPGVWETGNAVNDQKLRLTQTDDALTLDVIYAAVPEPSTLALAGLGLVGLAWRLRRPRR